MIQTVKASDEFRSQLFQWNVERQILSLPHGKDIWYAKLETDGKFIVIESKPKPKAQANKSKN